MTVYEKYSELVASAKSARDSASSGKQIFQNTIDRLTKTISGLTIEQASAEYAVLPAVPLTLGAVKKDPLFALAIIEGRDKDAVERFCNLRGYPQSKAVETVARQFVFDQMECLESQEEFRRFEGRSPGTTDMDK
jgi:hypothetical protein